MQHRGGQQSLLHQPSCWCNSCLVGALETSAPPMSCWCNSCLVGALETSAPPMSYWCNSCLVGALETSAPPMDTTKRASTALISTT